MDVIRSDGVPVAELKKNSKIFYELLSIDDLLKVAKSKKQELIFKDDQKMFFTTTDKELYFAFFKQKKEAVN
jgi:predicted ribosome-associated RNA-binding protein Tma20